LCTTEYYQISIITNVKQRITAINVFSMYNFTTIPQFHYKWIMPLLTLTVIKYVCRDCLSTRVVLGLHVQQSKSFVGTARVI